MGVVYEARDTTLGRRIALKTISTARTLSNEEREAFEKRFLAEARIAARLSHPGIVTVHDVGRDPGTGILFMALEHIEGRTLAQVLKEDPRPDWTETLRIVRALAEALHHAHTRGVVHRDVKPGNVMMLPSGRPKIMDFGIARVETSLLTAAGEVLGTPLYMSPEQARGEKVDGRADLFSLGSITYALLTGRPAFGAENTMAVILRVLSEDPPPPSTLVAGLPPVVDALVAKALAKKAADRHPDGQALAAEVDAILRASGTEPAGEPAELPSLDPEAVVEESPAPAAPTSRRTMLVALGTAAMAALLAGAYASLHRGAGSGISGEPASPEASSSPARPQLIVDFEHPVRTGMLRVWLDDQPVIEQQVDSWVTRDIGAVKLRKGRLERTFDVDPGIHSVRVEFSWEDNVKSERASAEFKSGVTRLEARIGRLRKNLSLEWK
jgi:eukaryotic-like serine/threonine-protein kinase